MSSAFLDASAVLAVVLEEPGADFVRQVINDGAFIGAVNLSEVVSRLTDLGTLPESIEALLGPLDLETISFDHDDAWRAGLLRSFTRRFGLSFGDRACFALAAKHQLPVVTGDRNWANVNVGVEVRLCR